MYNKLIKSKITHFIEVISSEQFTGLHTCESLVLSRSDVITFIPTSRQGCHLKYNPGFSDQNYGFDSDMLFFFQKQSSAVTLAQHVAGTQKTPRYTGKHAYYPQYVYTQPS